MTVHLRPTYLVALLLACACSSTVDGPTAGPSSPEAGESNSARAQQACLEMADILGKAAQRCGSTYQEGYDAVIRDGAGGDCKNVVQLRDETSLRTQCFPALANATCADLSAGALDDSCKQQLMRPQ